MGKLRPGEADSFPVVTVGSQGAQMWGPGSDSHLGHTVEMVLRGGEGPSLGVSQTWVHSQRRLTALCVILGLDVDEPLSSSVRWMVLRRSKQGYLHSAWHIVNAGYAVQATSTPIWPLRESFIHEQIFIGHLLRASGAVPMWGIIVSDERDKVPARREQIINQ